MMIIDPYRFGGGGGALPFIFSVTVGAGESFQLPTTSSGVYNALVDWGDSSSDTITAWNQAEITHDYTASGAGTYEITISGVFNGWSVNGYVDRLKIREVKQWGILKPGTGDDFMLNAANFTCTATDILDISACTSMSAAFNGTTALTGIPSINSWDFSGITTMFQMFRLSNFNTYFGDVDVSNVVSLARCFQDNPSYNQPFTNWVTSSNITLLSFLESANSFNQPIVFNTSLVTNMARAFRSSVFNQDMTSLDYTQVTSMQFCLRSANMSVVNWSNMLIEMESQAVKNNVIVECNAKHNASASAARAALIADHSWTIIDAGLL